VAGIEVPGPRGAELQRVTPLPASNRIVFPEEKVAGAETRRRDPNPPADARDDPELAY